MFKNVIKDTSIPGSKIFFESIVVGISSFILIVALSPWFGLIDASVDEGMNLAKATLLSKGIGPYGAVWNDQGPVLTIILAILQKVAPWNVAAARMTIAGFASSMLVAIYFTVRVERGSLPALASAMLLGSCGLFVWLSSAIMIGLPAISLAVIALTLILNGVPKLARVMLSAILFAAALQTKLFVFTLIPAFLVALAGIPSQQRKLIFAWLLTCSACFLVINLVTGETFLTNLILPHITITPETFPYPPSYAMIKNFVHTNPLLAFTGLLSLTVTLIQKGKGNRQNLITGTWLIAATGALLLHFPVWDHQILLLAVPLAWSGGPLLVEAVRFTANFMKMSVLRSNITQFFTVLFIILIFAPLGYRSINKKIESELQNEVATLSEFSGLGETVVTDRAILAFRAKLIVPPELAVWSNKRIQIGEIDDKSVLEVVKRVMPPQILFQRFPPSSFYLMP